MDKIEKSKRISDAVGELDEDIVAEADGERRISANENIVNSDERVGKRPVIASKKKKILIPAVSLAACAAITLGIIFGGGNGNPNIFDLPVYAEVLAEAKYPYAVPYPDESGYVSDSEREQWYEQKKDVGKYRY